MSARPPRVPTWHNGWGQPTESRELGSRGGAEVRLGHLPEDPIAAWAKSVPDEYRDMEVTEMEGLLGRLVDGPDAEWLQREVRAPIRRVADASVDYPEEAERRKIIAALEKRDISTATKGLSDDAAAYVIQQRLGDEDSSQKRGNDVGHARPVLGEH